MRASPRIGHSRANVMCAKSTSYSTIEVEEMFLSELQIAIYQLLLKKNIEGCQYSVSISPARTSEVSRLLPWGRWGLGGRGDESVLTSLFPCLIFYQTVLQTRFVMLPLCIGKRHPLPLSPAGSTPPNSRQAFQFLKNTFIQQSAGTGTMR